MRNMKIEALLMFAAAAFHCRSSEAIDVILGNCDDVIRLPCKATVHTKKYRYVMWYKGENKPIIKKKNTEYTPYVNISVSVGENETLELYNAQLSDSGEYKCYLAANVGSRSYESFVRLNISECVYVNTTHPTTMIYPNSYYEVPEVSVASALIGFFLISVAKIILCIVTVGVCDRVIFRRRRKKQEVRGSMNGTSQPGKTETLTKKLMESL